MSSEGADGGEGRVLDVGWGWPELYHSWRRTAYSDSPRAGPEERWSCLTHPSGLNLRNSQSPSGSADSDVVLEVEVWLMASRGLEGPAMVVGYVL